MIVLALVLILLALLIPALHVLFWIGVVVGIVGIVLLVAGASGNSVGGRRFWF